MRGVVFRAEGNEDDSHETRAQQTGTHSRAKTGEKSVSCLPVSLEARAVLRYHRRAIARRVYLLVLVSPLVSLSAKAKAETETIQRRKTFGERVERRPQKLL